MLEVVERTGAQVNIDDDGIVTIAAADGKAGQAAKQEVEGLAAPGRASGGVGWPANRVLPAITGTVGSPGSAAILWPWPGSAGTTTSRSA